MLVFLAFGGVFLSLKSIPNMLAWAPYVTPSKFAYGGLIKNELCNVTFTIGTGTMIPGLGELKANLRGDQVLNKMGFNVNRWSTVDSDVSALVVVPFCYLMLTWCVVKWTHVGGKG